MFDQLRSLMNYLQRTKKLPKGTLLAEFKISGMHCPSCSLNIDNNLEDLHGVIEASTSYAKGITKIYYDPKKIQLDQIKKCVVKSGYQLV